MRKILILLSIVLFAAHTNADYAHITKQISHIEKEKKLTIGVAAIHIESGKFFHYRQDELFKMASTMKLPVAIYLLHQVKNKNISLSKMVRIEPHDLVLGSGRMGYYLTYPSLIISIHNLLEAMMAISCNSSTDVILKYIGGVRATSNFIHSLGFKEINLNNNCEDLYYITSGMDIPKTKIGRTLKNWKDEIKNQPLNQRRIAAKEYFYNNTDTATPRSMMNLLVDLFNGSILGRDYSEMLLDIMSRCTENERITKHLPYHVKTSHKTGSWWDRNGRGHEYATFSDVGIIYLPKGKGHVALAIYSKSDKNPKRGDHLKSIAKIAHLIYKEFYTKSS